MTEVCICGIDMTEVCICGIKTTVPKPYFRWVKYLSEISRKEYRAQKARALLGVPDEELPIRLSYWRKHL